MKKEFLYIIIAILSLIIVFIGVSLSKNTKPTSHEDMSMSEMVEALEGLEGDEFDKSFIDMMIAHHEGAVEMANIALSNAKHSEIKDLSIAIIEAQNEEIEKMHEWYVSWGYGSSASHSLH
jgi:uncharacterized protein (DUF305 family)